MIFILFGSLFLSAAEKSIDLNLDLNNGNNNKVTVGFTSAYEPNFSVDTEIPEAKNLELKADKISGDDFVFSGDTYVFYQINSNNKNLKIYLMGDDFENNKTLSIKLGDLTAAENKPTGFESYEYVYSILPADGKIVEANIYRVNVSANVPLDSNLSDLDGYRTELILVVEGE